MKIGRTLPPAAAPVPWQNLLRSITALLGSPKEDRSFEEELRKVFKIRHCFLLSSGKAALTLTLKGLQKLYPDREEVLIPPYTCYSVPASIKAAGLKIKLCDTAVDSFDFDIVELEKKLLEDAVRQKILCALPTHLYGIPAEVSTMKLLQAYRIPVVDDAAQSMGGQASDGSLLGTTTDAGIYSIGRGKVLSCGEGGIIVTSRDDLCVGHFKLFCHFNVFNKL